MSAPSRYDDLGTVNAVKLLPKIDSYNGYIQLYTELDSHIEEGDIVFITFSGDTNTLNYNIDVILDNYTTILYANDFIYNPDSQGYKVIYVDKNINTFVIDKLIYTIPTNGKIYGHYVSKVICNNITINNAKVDGTVFRNATIDSNDQPSNITLTQCVMFNGDINDCNIVDKYGVNYVSLLLNYNSTNDTYVKYSNLDNNGYGYSYYYDLSSSLENCNISSGNYYNCSIKNTISGSTTITRGYFYNCSIQKYDIYGGYFHNTSELSNDSTWHYGSWYGNTFELNTWEDGIFLNGTFGIAGNNSIWQDGVFLNGNWRGLIWVNGDFSGGNFQGTGYTDISTGQNIGTQWFDGKFRGGLMKNTSFNTIFWKNGTVYGGELHNVVFNKGDIYDGIFYNVTLKNTNIYGGNFEISRDSVAVFNRFANSKIYDGDFNGVWCNPIYNSGGTLSDYVYGLNEFSDSEINNGVFTYPAFYNFNTINYADVTDGLFFSPITIYDGKFSGGQKNYLSKSPNGSPPYGPFYLPYGYFTSNQFNSEYVTMSKGSIKSKILYDTTTNATVTKMYIEFDNGHNFVSSDASTNVKLFGFNSQELYNITTTLIENNRYLDPSKPIAIIGTGYSYQTANAVGDDYVILVRDYNSWMFGDTGLIQKMDFKSGTTLATSSASTTFYELYGGTYNNAKFYGNINVYNGNFNNVIMSNGIQWYNGIFNGSSFQSQSGNPENNWYNGKFYNGVFGLNVLGQKETTRISIFRDNSVIDNSNDGPLTSSTYVIECIYPLVYQKSIALETNLFLGISAFATSSNQLEIEWSSVVTDDRSKSYMNDAVWKRETSYSSSTMFDDTTEYTFSPYEFVFKLNCTTYESRILLKKAIDFVLADTDGDLHLQIINPGAEIIESDTVFVDSSAVTLTAASYASFESLYGMDYDFVNYVIGGSSSGHYPLYLIFKFNTIKDLYDNCTSSEKEMFARNFRNVWSIANSGYYTHPMPVLNGPIGGTSESGNDDTTKVGKMVIKYSDDTAEHYTTNTKWIYGSCPPPWWITGSTTPSINWNIMIDEQGITGVTDIIRAGTFTSDSLSVIQNNGEDCDGFYINKNDIPYSIYNSIDRCTVDVNALSTTNYTNPYNQKFTDWLYFYITQHKNHSGTDFTNTISFRDIYVEQGLTDPSFNMVKDFRTQYNATLNNLIYNSQLFKCSVVGKAVYFDTTFNLSDYFAVGDKIYLENTSVMSNLGTGTETGTEILALAAGGIILADTSLDDAEYTITKISGFNYDTFKNNILYIEGTGVLSTTNCAANAYIMNRGLIVPFYYYVGRNDLYPGGANSQCNVETFKYMLPYNYTLGTGITSASEYSDNISDNIFVQLNYKNWYNKLAIRMQPIFHNYFPEPGFYMSNINYLGSISYYQHRNVYYCEMVNIGSTHRLIFNDVLPWTMFSGNSFWDYNSIDYKIDGIITGATGLTSYLSASTILEKWRYGCNGKNWVSLSCYADDDTNSLIKGTWQVSNSGLTGATNDKFYVEIVDPEFQPLSLAASITCHVGIEPTISCSGKIVNILYKNLNGTIITINTTILDYDFVNKAYIFDTIPISDMDATDIWIGTNMKTSNIFNLSSVTDSVHTVAEPSRKDYVSYNLPYWNTVSPYGYTQSTVTFPNSFERLSINPNRDYFINTVISYSSEIDNPSPIYQRVVNSSGADKGAESSLIYDLTTQKYIFNDMTGGLTGNIYQTSYISAGTWRNPERDYEVELTGRTDIWGNNALLEKIKFIRTLWSTNSVSTSDKLQIGVVSNWVDINSRTIIKEVNLKEKMSISSFTYLYPTLFIDKDEGMSYFGVNQVYSNDSQDRIWNLMKYSFNNELSWYYLSNNYSTYHNFQDAALFSVYHSYRKDALSNYSSFNINDVFMEKLYYDMYTTTNTYSTIWNSMITQEDKENFRTWNQYDQTSTQNFNKMAGIQIYSRNVSASVSNFKDQWYNGEFYGYRFEGAWHGGRWVSGDWFGWNTLNPDIATSGDTAFEKPTDFDITSIPKQNYEVNYTSLKKRKKYYDIAPWDQANNKYNDVVNLPIRKKINKI